MTKKNKKIVDQLTFDFVKGEDPAKVLTNLKKALTKAIKKRGRAAVAEHLTMAADKTVTEDMVNNWTAVSKPGHVPPVHYLHLICAFCNDYTPWEVLVGANSLEVIDEKEKVLLEFGKVFLSKKENSLKEEEINSKILHHFFLGKK